MIINKIAEFFATFFYIGKIKYCPGTFGSLAAFPLSYIIVYFTLTNQVVFSFANFNFAEKQLLTLFIIMMFSSLLIFAVGLYSTSLYLKYLISKNVREDSNTRATQQFAVEVDFPKGSLDPKEVVIDEVAGQLLVITLCSFSIAFINYSRAAEYLSGNSINFIFLFLLPFSLFRLFDIIKPWPINWLDKNIKGAWGIMIDDIAAAIFASVMHYAIIFLIIDRLK